MDNGTISSLWPSSSPLRQYCLVCTPREPQRKRSLPSMTHISPVRAGKGKKRTALEKRLGKSLVKELLFSWSDRVVVISGLYNADGL